MKLLADGNDLAIGDLHGDDGAPESLLVLANFFIGLVALERLRDELKICGLCFLSEAPVAMLEFFPAAAMARGISADFHCNIQQGEMSSI